MSNTNLNLFKIKGNRFIHKFDNITFINYYVTIETRLGRIFKHFIEKSYKTSQVEYLNLVKEFYNGYTTKD